MRIELMPVSTPKPEMHSGNFCPLRGFQTARLPERGLREKEGD
jgi:hypothetical protein